MHVNKESIVSEEQALRNPVHGVSTLAQDGLSVKSARVFKLKSATGRKKRAKIDHVIKIRFPITAVQIV